MKPGVSLLRAVAWVCTSLALTACGGAMTPEEAAADEAALATSEAALGSCGTWSGWANTGATTCQPNASCGNYWVCERRLKADDAPSIAGGPEQRPPVCPSGEVAVMYYELGKYNQQSQYRVCFDAAGTYTHTEWQYQTVSGGCSGC
ncbi:hypothetical protein [Corallococcus carmarthensis]|uniref:hypothetical protein n=1 Tax=Corallococcus carmarthensis TaxID=2316728 RepID=UPI0011C35A99|nr:hypothetical protein [Corallococcus carmarthensis]